MKIVGLKEFLALPQRTIFQVYKDGTLGPLMKKGESLDYGNPNYGDPYEFAPLAGGFDLAAAARGEDASLGREEFRTEASGDLEQRFAVWTPEDVAALQDRLYDTMTNEQLKAFLSPARQSED